MLTMIYLGNIIRETDRNTLIGNRTPSQLCQKIKTPLSKYYKKRLKGSRRKLKLFSQRRSSVHIVVGAVKLPRTLMIGTRHITTLHISLPRRYDLNRQQYSQLVMSNYNAPYGYGPSEPAWVSRTSPFLSCLDCERVVHEETLHDGSYCEDCAPWCGHCDKRSHDTATWKDMLLCLCCYEEVYPCDKCQTETLEPSEHEGYYFCMHCIPTKEATQ